MDHARRLSGRRILILEDEPQMAALLRRVLEDAGATVIGPTSDGSEAIQLLDGTGVEAAVVDWRVGAGNANTFAHLLTLRRIPFLFHTGVSDEAASQHPGVPVLAKPFRAEQLLAAVEALLRPSST
jgi:DNA-binding response OmpR family regulator